MKKKLFLRKYEEKKNVSPFDWINTHTSPTPNNTMTQETEARSFQLQKENTSMCILEGGFVFDAERRNMCPKTQNWPVREQIRHI